MPIPPSSSGYSVFRVSLSVTSCILLAAITLVSCSEASPRLSAWPDLGKESAGDNSRNRPEQGADSAAGAGTQTEEESKDQDSRPRDDSESAASSTGESSEDNDATGSDSDSTQSSQEDSGSGSDEGNSESAEPNACEQELCVELNGEGKPDRSRWRRAYHTFPITIPDITRRLARIELVEGFAKGTTTVELRKAMSSRSASLANFSWEFDLKDRYEWTGGDLDEPLELPANTVIWVEVKPVMGSIASVSGRGKEVSMWYRPLRGHRWTKNPAPVMFRAYCCKEP